MFTSFLETKTMAQNLIWIITLYDLIDWLADSVHLLFHIKYTSDHFLHQSINCLKKNPEELNNKEKQQIFWFKKLEPTMFRLFVFKNNRNYLLIIDWWIDQLISSFSLNAHHIFGWGLCCS